MKKIIKEWQRSRNKNEGLVEWLLIRKLSDRGKMLFSLLLVALWLPVAFRFDFYLIAFPVVLIIAFFTGLIELFMMPEVRRHIRNFNLFLPVEGRRLFFRKETLAVGVLFFICGGLLGMSYLQNKNQSSEAFIANQTAALRTVLDTIPETSGRNQELRQLLIEEEQLTNRLYSNFFMEQFTIYAETENQQLGVEDQLHQKFGSQDALNFIRSVPEIKAQRAINQKLIDKQIVINRKETTAFSQFSLFLSFLFVLVQFTILLLAREIKSVEASHRTLYRPMPVGGFIRIMTRWFLYQGMGLILFLSACSGYFLTFFLIGKVGHPGSYYSIYWLNGFKAVQAPQLLFYILLYFLCLNGLFLLLQAILSDLLKNSYLALLLLISLALIVGLLYTAGSKQLAYLNILFFPAILSGEAVLSMGQVWQSWVGAILVLITSSLGSGWLLKSIVTNQEQI